MPSIDPREMYIEGWATLPPHVLEVILDQMDIKERFILGGVCRTWRYGVRQKNLCRERLCRRCLAPTLPPDGIIRTTIIVDGRTTSSSPRPVQRKLFCRSCFYTRYAFDGKTKRFDLRDANSFARLYQKHAQTIPELRENPTHCAMAVGLATFLFSAAVAHVEQRKSLEQQPIATDRNIPTTVDMRK